MGSTSVDSKQHTRFLLTQCSCSYARSSSGPLLQILLSLQPTGSFPYSRPAPPLVHLRLGSLRCSWIAPSISGLPRMLSAWECSELSTTFLSSRLRAQSLERGLDSGHALSMSPAAGGLAVTWASGLCSIFSSQPRFSHSIGCHFDLLMVS